MKLYSKIVNFWNLAEQQQAERLLESSHSTRLESETKNKEEDKL
jgi:hypothetical protein